MKRTKTDPVDLTEKAKQAADELYRELKGCLPNNDPPREYKMNKPPYERKGRTSPVIEYVRSLGEDFLTGGEVASILDCSSSYIRKISNGKEGPHVPSYKARFGKHTIRIYTPEDVELIREYIESRFKLEKNDGQEDQEV
jgi:hypothetical protein